MEKTDKPQASQGRKILTRGLTIVVTVLLIVWFLPREEGQLFRYDVGRPWSSGSVIAKFDFPVYKTDEVIKYEQDSLMKQFQPYYNFDTDVEKRMVEKFLKNFQNGLSGLPASYKSLVYNQLHQS